MKISVDQTKCLAYGNCITAADDLFDLDENALVMVLQDNPPQAREAAARRAAALCPVSAITIVDGNA